MQQNLPPHVRQAVDEAWASRLAQQAGAWKSTRAGRTGATDTGVIVIRRPKRTAVISQSKSLG